MLRRLIHKPSYAGDRLLFPNYNLNDWQRPMFVFECGLNNFNSLKSCLLVIICAVIHDNSVVLLMQNNVAIEV